MDAGSDDDSMPGLEVASDAEEQQAPVAQHTAAAAAAGTCGAPRVAGHTSSSRGQGRGGSSSSSSSSSSFQRGFLGRLLQQSSWSREQQLRQAQWLRQLHDVQAVSSGSDEQDDGEGSAGSWETASDPEAEHAEGCTASHHNDDKDEDTSCEEEGDEDEYDEGDMDCDCPQCQSMRALAVPQPAATGSGSSSSSTAQGRGRDLSGAVRLRGQGPTADLAQSLLASIMGTDGSSSTQRRRNPAAGAPAAGAPFSRQRSNGFVVPGTSSEGNAHSSAAAQGSDIKQAERRSPKGLPPLQRPRSNRPADAAGSNSSEAAAVSAVPPGLMAPADARQLVQQVGDALSDASFTQELLAGLPGVDPAHGSVRQALTLLRGKAWAPAQQATAAAAVAGRKGPMVAFEQMVFGVNASQATRLVARWRHY